MRFLVTYILMTFAINTYAETLQNDQFEQIRAKELKAIKLINIVNESKPNFNYHQSFVANLQQIKEELGQNKGKLDQNTFEKYDKKLNLLIKDLQIYLNS